MNLKQNILILGSEGFIGSNLVKYLHQTYSIFGIDILQQHTNNYTYWHVSGDNSELASCFARNRFDFCINVAGSGNVGSSIHHPDIDFRLNVIQTHQVLEAIRIHQPECQYIHFSSAAVYGDPKHLPISESDEINPLSPYGWHKWHAENLCKEYDKIYAIPTVILRPFSVYGPGLKKQLFWDIFKKYKDDHDHIELWGTGNETRDFIYIKDLCRCVETIMVKGDFNSSIYNIGTGNEISIHRAAASFLMAINPGIKIKFNNKTKPGDPLKWKADISKINNLGFTPQYSFDEGILQVIKWIQNQN